jgi:hypothetical protein
MGRTQDADYLDKWRQAALAAGHPPEAVKVLVARRGLKRVFCTNCGAALIGNEDVELTFLGVPHGRATYLCEKCEIGEAGHEAFHADIRREQERAVARSSTAREEAIAHSVAENEHADCPWAARGEPCDYVDPDAHERLVGGRPL